MPKRVLAARNQDEDEPTSSATIASRSAGKRLKTDAKIEGKVAVQQEKENQAKSKRKTKSKASGNKRPSANQALNTEYTTARVNKSEPMVVSKTAFFWSDKYLQKTRHGTHDADDMYVRIDFSDYGELQVVEDCVADLATTMFFLHKQSKEPEQVNYVLAFRRLEALTILLEHVDAFSNIDDGERFYAFMRLVGACYVTILRGLLPAETFRILTQIDGDLQKKLEKIETNLPNLGEVLEKAMVVGDLYLRIGDTFSSYTNVLRIVYTNWLLLLKNQTIDLESVAPKSKKDLWKALRQALDIEKYGIMVGGPESFNFLEELKTYQARYGRKGNDSYDLSKWSKAERAGYSLDRFDDSDEVDAFSFF